MKKSIMVLIVFAVIFVMNVPLVQAGALFISDDHWATWTAVMDGGVGDLNPAPGEVSYTSMGLSSSGNWIVGINAWTTGGSASSPFMTVWETASSWQPGTLQIEYSENLGPFDGYLTSNAEGFATRFSVTDVDFKTYVKPLGEPAFLLTEIDPTIYIVTALSRHQQAPTHHSHRTR